MKSSPDGFYLSALSVNPNRQFYSAMGGSKLSVPDVQLGSELYSQVGFAWKQFA